MKKTRKPVIHPDDSQLFRVSVSDVTPLKHPSRIEHDRPLPRPVPSQRVRDDQAALADSLGGRSPWDAGGESGEELSFARNGISQQVVGKLRRGHWATQGELDLHGLTVEQSREQLVEFLRQCGRNNWRCVRIIHGKGLGSRNREPVLKRKVAGWLMQRDEILAFCQARRADGGSGAVVVLLKNRK